MIKASNGIKIIKIRNVSIFINTCQAVKRCSCFLIPLSSLMQKHCLVLCSPSDHTYWSFIFTPIGLAWLHHRSILFWCQRTDSEHSRLLKYFNILQGQTNTVLVFGLFLFTCITRSLFIIFNSAFLKIILLSIKLLPLRYIYLVTIQQTFHFPKPSASQINLIEIRRCPSVRLCISFKRHHHHSGSNIWLKNTVTDLQPNLHTEQMYDAMWINSPCNAFCGHEYFFFYNTISSPPSFI